ncbi:MAG: N-acetyl-gamma-glutamyl-phosphate reductase [Oligoflexia bacterium]|nr:N-acetyl-gamma-glutamyl-phosphate reductase [Oligoflexia bacterium]
MHNYVTTKSAPKVPATPVAIVGARGYSGLELARLLMRHPEANLVACYGHDKNFSLSDVFSGTNLPPVLPLEQLGKTEAKTVFLATPAEASLELAPALLARGINVIDLSGAFRLEAKNYPQWYGLAHPQARLLTQACYGLVPFAGPARDKPALIANPGCYATSVLMALIPLLKKNLIQKDSIVIDAKSGTTGAGKKAAENLLHAEVEGECLPYRVGRHQHLPEITRYLNTFGGTEIDLAFTTHLLPVRRGIICSIYARPEPGVTAAQIRDAFHEAYANYPLAEWSEIQNDTKNWQLSLNRVVGSPRVQLAYSVSGNRLYLFSLIDNLLKGAASQAIENFNRLQDLPVTTGLDPNG